MIDQAPSRPPSRVSRVARIFIFIAAGLVLAATLYPAEAMGDGGGVGCLICGDRGLADAIVNVILFMPLGAAAGLAGRSTRTALLVGAILSGGVEAAQMTLIPGRDASLGDLLFNTTGAALGVLLLRSANAWLRFPQQIAARMSLLSATLVLLMIGLTGFLFVPQPQSGTYYTMWRPLLLHLDPYPAPVHSVMVGPDSVPPARVDNPARLQAQLRSGGPIRVVAEAAPAPTRISALFAVYDGLRQEVLLFGPDREDVVFRTRMRAASLLLDYPDYRAPGAWRATTPGRPVEVVFERAGLHYCLGLGPKPPCNYGFYAAMGWALFLYIEHWPVWFQSTLSFLWLMLLGLPIGFWARRRWESYLAVALFAGSLTVLPPLVGLLFTPPHHLASGLVGVGIGAALARLVASHE